MEPSPGLRLVNHDVWPIRHSYAKVPNIVYIYPVYRAPQPFAATSHMYINMDFKTLFPDYRSQNFYSSIHHDALPFVSVLVLPL